MQNGGVEVADVNGVFDDIVGVIIGGTVTDSAFHSAAGNPCTEAASVVIASFAEFSLAIDGASEFTTPDHECIF